MIEHKFMLFFNLKTFPNKAVTIALLIESSFVCADIVSKIKGNYSDH